jgi:hypothetical protein
MKLGWNTLLNTYNLRYEHGLDRYLIDCDRAANVSFATIHAKIKKKKKISTGQSHAVND